MANRRVTLLPNSYDKNRSMFETWLRDLGCEWRENLDGVDYMPETGIEQCWKWQAGPPSSFQRWSLTPRGLGCSWQETGQGNSLYSLAGIKLVDCDDVTRFVWDLCDGERTLEEITSVLIEAYPDDTLNVACGVQKTLTKFMAVPRPCPGRSHPAGAAIR